MTTKLIETEIYKSRLAEVYYAILKRTKLNFTVLILTDNGSETLTTNKVLVMSRDQFTNMDLVKTDRSLGLGWK